jgi:hypothetical protein
MIKLKSLLESKALMSEAMQYHYDNKISITENIFRGQSLASLDLIAEARKLYESGRISFDGLDEMLFTETDLGLFGTYEGKKVPLDYPMIEEELDEAEYRGKDVELNKPKRGGRRKFYVYTKNDKGNVVKVSFGDTSGLSVKLRDPKAVKSFVARHKCGTGEKRWSARYWSCRLPRYASALGLKGKTSGYW